MLERNLTIETMVTNVLMDSQSYLAHHQAVRTGEKA